MSSIGNPPANGAVGGVMADNGVAAGPPAPIGEASGNSGFATATGEAHAATESAPAPQRCANCGTSVPLEYCGKCGQRLEHSLHSVWHFLREATEDLTHADSRLWRTLIALLLKPGFLTNEFRDGRRVSYLPPLRLYLVLSVAFFLLASVSHLFTNSKRKHAEATVAGMAQARSDLASAASDLSSAPGVAAAATAAVSSASSALSSIPATTDNTAKARDQAGDTDTDTNTPAAATAAPVAGRTESKEQKALRLQRACGKLPAGSPSDFFSLRRACLTLNGLSDQGDGSFREQILHNAPRAMFFFLPLLALGMKLVYWRPRRYYVEHLLFFLHNHAFVFLLFSLYIMVSLLVPWTVVTSLMAFAAWLYFPYYLYRSMRNVYGQGRALTLLKLTALSFYYFTCALVMVIFVAIYAALVA